MKVIYGVNNIRKFRRPVVAIGVFDGVHRAHKEILKEAAAKGRRIHGTSMALTFWPHPQREESLYSLEHRLRLISELGIDVCMVIGFNRRFADITAEDFTEGILYKRIGAEYVFVGENFRFGKHAKGDIASLLGASKNYNFKVKAFRAIRAHGEPISSTYIRALIKKGKLGYAERLLGRPVSVFGSVIKGASLGRKLGFPTANIRPHHEVIPPCGVYAVRVNLENKILYGAGYIGRKGITEVFIFNFKRNIYAKKLEMQFIKKIRGAGEFATQAALARQIKKDITFIKYFFSRH